jgi:hypothetical protein
MTFRAVVQASFRFRPCLTAVTALRERAVDPWAARGNRGRIRLPATFAAVLPPDVPRHPSPPALKAAKGGKAISVSGNERGFLIRNPGASPSLGRRRVARNLAKQLVSAVPAPAGFPPYNPGPPAAGERTGRESNFPAVFGDLFIPKRGRTSEAYFKGSLCTDGVAGSRFRLDR